jgi:hypothetical protein
LHSVISTKDDSILEPKRYLLPKKKNIHDTQETKT